MIKKFSFSFFYNTDLIKLSAIGLLWQSREGGASEDNNQNFARSYLTEISLIFNHFHQLKQKTKMLQRVPPRSFFSPSGSLQNQSEILIGLKKNKALPEGGQQLNPKNDIDQDQVIIRRWTRYFTQ